jgi:hypothetical protein
MAKSADLRAKAIQNSRSRVWKCGRFVVRLTAVNCCRSARFSKTSVSAERQRQRAADHNEQLQHASIVAGVGATINADEFWRGV